MSEQTAGTQRPATASGVRPKGVARVNETAQLQDRLRNILHRQAEAKQNAQKTVAERRRTARALHDENVALRNIINAEVARIEHVGCPARSGMPADITEAECEQLRLRIHLARRRCNRLDYETQCLERQLADSAEQEGWLRDTVAQPYATAAAVGQRSTWLRIRALERRLDETLRTQGLVRTIAEQYRMHASALKGEGKAYDAQTQALEREYVDRHRDHLQLATLYSNAQRGLEAVLRKRNECLRRMSQHREQEEAALAEKKASVDAALAITQRIELQQRTELQQQLEEEAQMLQAAEAKRAQLEQSQRHRRSTLSTLPAVLLSPAMAGLLTSNNNNNSNHHRGAENNDDDDDSEAERRVYEKALHTLLMAAKVNTQEELMAAFEEQAARRQYMSEELKEKREKCAALEQRVKHLRALRQQAQSGYAVHNNNEHKGVHGNTNNNNNNRAEHDDDESSLLLQPDMAAHSRLMMSEMEGFIAKTERELRSVTMQNAENEATLREALHRLSALVALTAPYRPDVVLPSSFTYPAMSMDKENGVEACTKQVAKKNNESDNESCVDTVAMQELQVHLSVLAHKLIALADDAAHSALVQAETPRTNTITTTTTIVPPSSQYSTPIVIPANNLRITLPQQQHSHQHQQQRLLTPSATRRATDDAADMDTSFVAAESSALFSIEGTGLAAAEDDVIAQNEMTSQTSTTSDHTTTSSSRIAASYRETSAGLGRRVSLSHTTTTPKTTRRDVLASAGRRRRGRMGRRDSLAIPDADLSEDPLQREEIKKMSATIMLREKKRRQRELAQGVGKGGL